MNLICIDPGPRQSGLSLIEVHEFNRAELLLALDIDNEMLLYLLTSDAVSGVDVLVYEKPGLFGQMNVQEEVFMTAEEAGRMKQAFLKHGKPVVPISRMQVKLELLRGNPKNPDTLIKNYLIERFGEVGTKKEPGPLGKFIGKKHAVQAMAAGVAVWDKVSRKELQLESYLPVKLGVSKNGTESISGNSERRESEERVSEEPEGERVQTRKKRAKRGGRSGTDVSKESA